MQRHRNGYVLVLLIVSVLCALMATAFGAHADDGIQIIRLHEHSFFIPKSWMGAGVDAERATCGGSVEGTWRKPQAEPIDATEIGLVHPDRTPAILRYWTDPLPSMIRVSTYCDTPTDLSILRPEMKKMLEATASEPADADGFVRIYLSQEKFLYRGYLNKLGHPLIIFSNNMETPFGDHYASDVFIPFERHLMLRYQFSNRKFPENTWWDLYQHTLAFLDYLQKPK
jgi:hypothetical protein